MKQLLLRVPEEVHARLAARAQREGRSINSVATEILDLTIDIDQGNRRDRLRAKAAALGILHPGTGSGKRQTPAERRRAIESFRGIGPVLDAILDEDRNRL